jgi:TusA-related sulfurtransferase
VIEHAVDGEGLELGGGLEVLLAAALERVSPGQELQIASSSQAVARELHGWARVAGHTVVDEGRAGHGPAGRYVVVVRRGAGRRVLADALPPACAPLPLQAGALRTERLRDTSGEAPVSLDSSRGLAPVGSTPESGRSSYRWRLNVRDELWSRRLATLTERSAAEQWNASDEIPWEAAGGLRPEIERAVAQVMTYIAQNEYAALYVPAGFLPQVKRGYGEVLLWLASHIHDEARHVEVFTKRSLAGGASGYALASTELSLESLLAERDFSAAALLLNVLGEGTFLDLLRFIELHAPDAATAAAARLAHRDERRHVYFGVAHVRHRLEHDPDERARLIASAEARAAKLTSLDGLSPVLLESLTVMTARSLQPAELAESAGEIRALMARMARNRVRRLRAAGFDERTAGYLSDLHTPNLM